MARADKEASVAEMTEAFRSSSAVLVTEYRGLTVSQLTQLRTELGGGTRYTVAKNTLARIAVGQSGIAGITELLTGPTAVVFVSGDPVVAAKTLRDFAKGNPALVVKGGFLEGRALTADEVRKLADLESREVLLAQLAGGMNATMARAAGLFAAPLSQVARLAAALRDQQAEKEAA